MASSERLKMVDRNIGARTRSVKETSVRGHHAELCPRVREGQVGDGSGPQRVTNEAVGMDCPIGGVPSGAQSNLHRLTSAPGDRRMRGAKRTGAGRARPTIGVATDGAAFSSCHSKAPTKNRHTCVATAFGSAIGSRIRSVTSRVASPCTRDQHARKAVFLSSSLASSAIRRARVA
jgi:hypothetical protein